MEIIFPKETIITTTTVIFTRGTQGKLRTALLHRPRSGNFPGAEFSGGKIDITNPTIEQIRAEAAREITEEMRILANETLTFLSKEKFILGTTEQIMNLFAMRIDYKEFKTIKISKEHNDYTPFLRNILMLRIFTKKTITEKTKYILENFQDKLEIFLLTDPDQISLKQKISID